MKLTQELLDRASQSELVAKLQTCSELCLDNTTYEAFVTCPMKGLIERVLRLKPVKPNAAFIFGEAFHKALERYYLGDSIEDSMQAGLQLAIKKDLDDLEDGKRNTFMLEELLRFYFYEEACKEKTHVLSIEGIPMVERSFAFKLGTVSLTIGDQTRQITITWQGKLDLVCDDAGIWGEDHKTTSVMGERFAQDKFRSSQMLGYSWAIYNTLKLFGRQDEFRGMRINAVAMRSKGFERRIFQLPYTSMQLLEWQEETLLTVQNILNELLATLTLTHEVLPRRVSCVSKYGSCPHFDTCQCSPIARERTLLSSGAYEADTWTPLANDDD